jgi:hypothetical protein
VKRLAALLLAAGCAAPFTEVKPSAPVGAVGVVYCGSSMISPQTLVQMMEPPVGSPDQQIDPPKELRVCLKLSNTGGKPARLDRSHVTLRCPHEKQTWVPDRDDEIVIAHPGETRELYVTFHYSPLVAGEDVAVVLENAITVADRAAKLPAITLRKK